VFNGLDSFLSPFSSWGGAILITLLLRFASVANSVVVFDGVDSAMHALLLVAAQSVSFAGYHQCLRLSVKICYTGSS
jgi:hypothetical protein